MTVTIQRKPLTPLTIEQRQLIKYAVLTGSPISKEDDQEVTEQVMIIAESLPEYLKKLRMPDSSANREKLLDMILSVSTVGAKSKKPRPGWYRRHR